MFAVIKMELSGKTVYGSVLKTEQLSAHAQNNASPERCHKSFTMIFLSDQDIPLAGSNFGNLTAFRAIFSHIFTAHAHPGPSLISEVHPDKFGFGEVITEKHDHPK